MLACEVCECVIFHSGFCCGLVRVVVVAAFMLVQYKRDNDGGVEWNADP